MELKKILGFVLIFILLIILLNSIKKSYATTTTTTKVVKTNSNNHNYPNMYTVNRNSSLGYNPNYNNYKAQYYK